MFHVNCSLHAYPTPNTPFSLINFNFIYYHLCYVLTGNWRERKGRQKKGWNSVHLNSKSWGKRREMKGRGLKGRNPSHLVIHHSSSPPLLAQVSSKHTLIKVALGRKQTVWRKTHVWEWIYITIDKWIKLSMYNYIRFLFDYCFYA